MSIKVAQKRFLQKNNRFSHPNKNCLRMCEIWANYLLPKALKTCPKSNKSPNLVTLLVGKGIPKTQLPCGSNTLIVDRLNVAECFLKLPLGLAFEQRVCKTYQRSRREHLFYIYLLSIAKRCHQEISCLFTLKGFEETIHFFPAVA